MLKFISRFFAIIGFLVFVLILITGGLIFFAVKKEAPKLPDNIVLKLKIDSSLQEVTNPNPLKDLISGKPKNFRTTLHALEKAATDDRVKGIVIQYTGHSLGLAEIQEFRSVLKNFQNNNKKCLAHADTIGEIGNGASAYFLLSSCEKLYLQPTGVVGLAGLSRTIPFGRKALDKIGVEPDFVHFGIYKSYPEMFEREDFSDPTRKMEENLMQNIQMEMVSDIAEDRHYSISQFESIFNQGPYTETESFKQHKLIDGLAYYNDIMDVQIKKIYPIDDFPGIKTVTVSDYANVSKKEKKHKVNKPTQIALIYADGEIRRGFENTDDFFEEENVIKGHVLATKIRDAAKDKNIAGIILRINSTGGSPVASETIRHAVENVRTLYKKPIIVSIGNVAASGGYWIAMSADKIVAHPLSITGSIGVFGGKFVVSDLAEKIGVNFSTISTGGNANFFSMTNKFTPEQRSRFISLMGDIYAKFVTIIKRDRDLKETDETKFAEGRVWTGEQAFELGLVDALGDLRTAENLMKEALKKDKTEEIYIDVYPRPLPALKQILSMKEENVSASFISLLQKSFLYHSLDNILAQQGQVQTKAYIKQD